jgi:PQQ-like domain
VVLSETHKMKSWFCAVASLLFACLLSAEPSWQGWRDGRANLFLDNVQVRPDGAFRQVWRSPTTGEGKSSPVIADGRIFYTSATLEDATLVRLHAIGRVSLRYLASLFCSGPPSSAGIPSDLPAFSIYPSFCWAVRSYSQTHHQFMKVATWL